MVLRPGEGSGAGAITASLAKEWALRRAGQQHLPVREEESSTSGGSQTPIRPNSPRIMCARRLGDCELDIGRVACPRQDDAAYITGIAWMVDGAKACLFDVGHGNAGGTSLFSETP